MEDPLFNAATRAEFFGTRHVSLFATTRAGKSYLVKKKIHGHMGTIDVYFNSANEAVTGRRVRTVRELHVGIRRGFTRFNFIPYQDRTDPERDAKRLVQLRAIVNLLFSIGERMRGSKDQIDTWCHLIVDEAHNYAPKGVSNPLQVVAVEGGKDGIRLIAISQRPAKIHHDVLTQTTHIYLRLNTYEGPYFREYEIPIDEFRGWIEQPHHFVIVEGSKWVPFQPV